MDFTSFDVSLWKNKTNQNYQIAEIVNNINKIKKPLLQKQQYYVFMCNYQMPVIVCNTSEPFLLFFPAII